MKKSNIKKILVFIILLVIFLFVCLLYIKEKENIVTNYKVTELSYKKIEFNASSIFLPSKKKIKVFYDFKEKKINKLPYKDNINYKVAYIHLNKEILKKLKDGIYMLQFNVKDKKYYSFLVTNPEIDNKGDILVLVPDLTLQAYSTSIGISLYKKASDEWKSENKDVWEKIRNKKSKKDKRSIWVNMYRPETFSNVNKLRWFYNGLKELQSYYNSKNIRFKFISQKFLHKNHNKFDLNKYKLIILFGHDEYWTYEIQKIIYKSTKKGLNILNLSGNTYWWTLKEDNGYINREIYGHNHLNNKLTNHEKLLGVSFRFGGYPLERKYKLEKIKGSSEFKFLSEKKLFEKINGLEIIKPEDSIFKGTGLKYGDIIGFQRKINKIEMDGVSEIKLINDLVKDNKKDKNSNYKLKKSNHEFLAATYAHREVPKKIGVITRNKYFKGRVISTGMISWAENIKDKTIKKITINMINELLR